MTIAFAGAATSLPTAAIFPPAMTSVPFAIGAEVLGMMDCAKSGSDANARISSLRILLSLSVFLRLVRFFLQPILLLLLHGLALLQVALTVEEDLAFDHGVFDARKSRRRRGGPDHEVGVFAGFDRADAVVEAQLLGGIDRAKPQRFFFAQPTVLHRLRGVVIEMARELVGVGVDGGDDAVAHHERDVVRRRVIGLGFVAPPVDERAAGGAVRR